MLKLCQENTTISMALPLDETKTLIFVAWLLNRGLQARTISTYLAGIRQTHLAKGLIIPTLRPDVVKQVLTGAGNLDRLRNTLEEKPKRLPVTVTIMKLLKLEIKESELVNEKKLLLWAVATLCFNGAFIIHEILSHTEKQFDPNFTLLLRDINLKTNPSIATKFLSILSM